MARGGTRKGAGRPKSSGPTRTKQVGVALTVDELAQVDGLREDGETRAAVFRRLLRLGSAVAGKGTGEPCCKLPTIAEDDSGREHCIRCGRTVA